MTEQKEDRLWGEELVERVALAIVNADQRRLDMPELGSVEEFRHDSDRQTYLLFARAAIEAVGIEQLRNENERLSERVELTAIWLDDLATHPDLDEVVADGGITAAMVIQQEAREQASRARAALTGEA